VRRFEQVRWVVGADEPGELQAQVDLEEVPVELQVGARVLLLEAQLVVDLRGHDHQQADQERDQQPGQPLPDEAGRVRERSEYQAPRPDTTNSSGIPHKPAKNTNSVNGRLGGWSFTQGPAGQDAGGVEEDQPATTAARIRSKSCRRGLPVVVMAEPTVQA
jgi:hypothetical protein